MSADPAAQLEPAGSGKHQVEDDQRELRCLDELTGAIPVGCLERREPVAPEVADYDLTNDRLVVDDQNGSHRAIVATTWSDGAPPSLR